MMWVLVSGQICDTLVVPRKTIVYVFTSLHSGDGLREDPLNMMSTYNKCQTWVVRFFSGRSTCIGHCAMTVAPNQVPISRQVGQMLGLRSHQVKRKNFRRLGAEFGREHAKANISRTFTGLPRRQFLSDRSKLFFTMIGQMPSTTY